MTMRKCNVILDASDGYRTGIEIYRKKTILKIRSEQNDSNNL